MIWTQSKTPEPERIYFDKFKIDIMNKNIYIYGPTKLIDIYNSMKEVFCEPGMMGESMPLTPITPVYFKVDSSWSIIGRRFIRDAGYSYYHTDNYGREIQSKNYVLFKGLGVPIMPADHACAGSDPQIQYKRRKNGQTRVMRNGWSVPNIIEFDVFSEGLWIIFSELEKKCCKVINFDCSKIKGVLHIPWLWYEEAYSPICPCPECVSTDEVKYILPNKMFEI